MSRPVDPTRSAEHEAQLRTVLTAADRLDDITRARMWSGIADQLAEPAAAAPTGARWTRSAAIAFGAVAIAATALLVVRAVRGNAADVTAAPGQLAVAADATLTTRLGPHARAALVGPARLELLGPAGDVTVVRLHEGTLLAEFEGGPGRALRIEAGDLVAEVVGTLFSVEVTGTSACVGVAHGTVRVTAHGASQIVGTQQELCSGDPAPHPLPPNAADQLSRHERAIEFALAPENGSAPGSQPLPEKTGSDPFSAPPEPKPENVGSDPSSSRPVEIREPAPIAEPSGPRIPSASPSPTTTATTAATPPSTPPPPRVAVVEPPSPISRNVAPSMISRPSPSGTTTAATPPSTPPPPRVAVVEPPRSRNGTPSPISRNVAPSMISRPSPSGTTTAATPPPPRVAATTRNGAPSTISRNVAPTPISAPTAEKGSDPISPAPAVAEPAKPVAAEPPKPAVAPQPTAEELYRAAEAALAAGDRARADRELARLLALPGGALADQALYERARIAYQRRDPKAARAQLAALAAIAGSPLAEPGHYLDCRIAVESKAADAERCFTAYRAAYPRSPHDLDVLAVLAQLAHARGGCPAARALRDELLARYPRSDHALVWRTRCTEAP